MLDRDTVLAAVARIREAAPDARVVVFGSYARNQLGPESDLDLLVIEPEVVSRRKEMVRLRDALRPLRIPVDILVTSEAEFQARKHLQGTIYHDIDQEGISFGHDAD